MNASILMLACLAGAEPAPATAPAAPVVVAAPSSSCGTATVSDCGTCDPCSHKIGLFSKLKSKLCNPCSKPTCETPCEKPACEVKVCKPIVIEIPKCETPCKAEPTCDPCEKKVCWKPGMLIHKIKDKLCNPCHKHDAAPSCEGGCGTAVIAPSTVAPAVAPVAPTTGPAPKEMPKDLPKADPKKVGSLKPTLTPVGSVVPF